MEQAGAVTGDDLAHANSLGRRSLSRDRLDGDGSNADACSERPD
jgi:hypothetical protein